jgi:DNA repair protein RecO (recombination protein O)
MHDKGKLYSANSIFEIIAISLKPREPHDILYRNLITYMDSLLAHPCSFLDYIKFELCLLTEIGYGLDLSKCCVSGMSENLSYVSPKTGRSVAAEAGGQYTSRLLKLPSFIPNDSEPSSSKEIEEALDLTGYFFRRYIFKDGKVPNYRSMLARLSMCEA